MNEENLNPASGNSGSATAVSDSGGGDSFSLDDFMGQAAAAPKVENPVYEPDTRSGNEPPPQPQPQNEPSEDPSGTGDGTGAPKRTLQEIQAHRSAQTKARDFTGLEEDEAALFKQMSQASYDKLYPAYLAHKESAKKIEELTSQLQAVGDRRWYEEENAYQLHPDYKAASQHMEDLDTEEAFWQEQLGKAEAGRPFNLLDRDSKGQYYAGSVVQPTPEGKAQIISNLAKLTQYKLGVGSKLESLKSSFAERYKGFNTSLAAIDKEMFGTLDMDKNAAVKSDYEAALSKLPKEFRGQLPYQMLAKADAVIRGLVRSLRTNEATKARRTSIEATALQAGPGGSNAGPAGGKTAADLNAGFERLTRRPLS